MNFKNLFHSSSSKTEASKSWKPGSQKLFYRPGTIEEKEEDIYDEPKFKIENETLLYSNCRNQLYQSAPNRQGIYTSASLSRLPAAPSLARISTANSSLYPAAGSNRQESTR